MNQLKNAEEIFLDCLAEIRQSYPSYNFYIERDFVWTLQKLLAHSFKTEYTQFKVFNDFPIEKGQRRSNSVDLAVIDKEDSSRGILKPDMKPLKLAVEFKFEPSWYRTDFCVHKCPVVFWRFIEKDIQRVERYVKTKCADVGIALFIDEHGRYHRTERSIGKNSQWIHWGTYDTQYLDVWVLMTIIRSDIYVNGEQPVEK